MTHAACALAAVHASRSGAAREFGLDASIAQYSSHFFNTSLKILQERASRASNYRQDNHSTISPPALSNSSPHFFQSSLGNEQLPSGFDETDVLAAMQMFQFVLYSGETPKVFWPLLMSYQWLEQTSIAMDSNPYQALSAATPLTRTVVKLLIVSFS